MAKRSIKDLKPGAGPGTSTFHNGYYNVKNRDKYIGDWTKVIYRSSWERNFCVFCDNSSSIEKWSSEPFPIEYFNPVDNKIHEYNVDFYIRMVHDNGTIEDYLVEIKPKHKLSKPIPPKSNTLKNIKKYNEQCKEYITNSAKFAAAKKFAALQGKKFIVITEDFLFGCGYKTEQSVNPDHQAYHAEWRKKRKQQKEAEARIKQYEEQQKLNKQNDQS